MTAMEFLKQAEIAEKRMQKAAQKVTALRCVCEKITASLEGIAVSHTKNVTAHEDNMLRLMEAEKEYRKAECTYKKTLDEVIYAISQIEDIELNKLLMRHYIQGVSLAAIAKELFLARATVYKRQKRALSALEYVLKLLETRVDTSRQG